MDLCFVGGLQVATGRKVNTSQLKMSKSCWAAEQTLNELYSLYADISQTYTDS